MSVSQPSSSNHTGQLPGHSKRRAEPAEEASHPAKTRRLDDSQPTLCEVCRSVNFIGIFDGTCRKQYYLPTLRQAISNVDCTFCQYIVQAAQAFTTQDEDDRHDYRGLARTVLSQPPREPDLDLGLTLKFRKNDSLYLQASSVNLFRQACLWLHNPGEGCLLASLDGTSDLSLEGSDIQPYTMVRRPVPEYFNSVKLREWLDTSAERATDHGERRGSKRKASLAGLWATQSFRLLDVHSGELVTPESEECYAALSYVWGDEMVQYISESMANPRRGVSLATAPQTIRDAASVVRAVDERFLWVDALCIEQNNAENKHANISQMGAIYQNALFTIVATEGEGANAGLSRLRHCGTGVEQPLIINTTRGLVSMLKARNDRESILKSTKWAMRGWTFQERVLSDTCVFFTLQEVLFYDRHLEAREAYELVPTNDQLERTHNPPKRKQVRSSGYHDLLLKGRQIPLTVYGKILDEYTARSFTYEGDRLDAFAGILGSLNPRKTSLDTMLALAGLPKENFTSALYFSNCRSNLPQERVSLNTRQNRLLPSWSWVGWKGRCNLGLLWFVSLEGERAEVLDAANVVCKLTDDTTKSSKAGIEQVPISRPLRTVLHLWAWVIDCDVVFRSSKTEFDIMVRQRNPSSTPLRLRPFTQDFAEMATPSPDREHRVILIAGGHYLLVERHGVFFERLGPLWLDEFAPGRGINYPLRNHCTLQWTRLQ